MQRETKRPRPSRNIAKATCSPLMLRAESAVRGGGGAKLVVTQLFRWTRQMIAIAMVKTIFMPRDQFRKLSAVGSLPHPLYRSPAQERLRSRTSFRGDTKHSARQKDF